MLKSSFWRLVGDHGTMACRSGAVATAVAAIGAVAAPAQAGIPPLELRWTVDGILLADIMPVGMDVGDGSFRYADTGLFDPGTGLTLQFSIVGRPDPGIPGPSLSLGITITNTTLATIDVVVEALLPVGMLSLDPNTVLGSAAYGLTTPKGGGTLGSNGDDPGWQALIDGIVVASLHDPLSVVNPGFGSNGVAANFGPLAGPAGIAGSLSIVASFSVTPLGQVSLTSGFAVFVPAPASLALVGIAFLGRRRRR